MPGNRAQDLAWSTDQASMDKQLVSYICKQYEKNM